MQLQRARALVHGHLLAYRLTGKFDEEEEVISALHLGRHAHRPAQASIEVFGAERADCSWTGAQLASR